MWNESQLFDYACNYGSYLAFKDLCRSVESHLLLIWGGLGFLGALGMSLTLSQKHFRPSPDFLFFRIVAYLEMLQMAVMTPMAATAFCNCEESYACAFIWAHVATTIMNVCADTVDLIVLFVCIERTVACLFPQHFRLIQSKQLRRSVIFGSFAVPAVFSVFQSFEVTVIYDEKEKRFIDEPSEFAQTPFYTFLVYANMVRFYITAAAIATATLCSIFGFIKTARRKERLLRRPRSNSQIALSPVSPDAPHDIPLEPLSTTTSVTVSNSNPARLCDLNSLTPHRLSDYNFTWRRNTSTSELEEAEKILQPGQPTVTPAVRTERRQREMDLCCLQLCLAAPIVINQVLYASGLNSSYSFVVGKLVFEYELTYEAALDEIAKAKSFHLLRTSTNISNVLAHALHFYLYLLFSVKVRRDFVTMLRGWYSCLKSRRRK